MSRFLFPEPPLYAGVDYDLVLVTVDKYGNDCSIGGTTLVARITGSNLPPGQETNVDVTDRGDGRYVLRLFLKGPCEFKLVVSMARDGQKLSKLEVSDPKNMMEFPPIPFKFESSGGKKSKHAGAPATTTPAQAPDKQRGPSPGSQRPPAKEEKVEVEKKAKDAKGAKAQQQSKMPVKGGRQSKDSMGVRRMSKK